LKLILLHLVHLNRVVDTATVKAKDMDVTDATDGQMRMRGCLSMLASGVSKSNATAMDFFHMLVQYSWLKVANSDLKDQKVQT